MNTISPQHSVIQSLYHDFLVRLKEAGFSGEMDDDYANRLVLATDNSIYQRLPQAVVYPTCITDLQSIATLLD